MQAPQGQRWRLLATFNSGFQFADAHGGFVVNGRTYEPLVAGQGTLVMYRDGHVDVLSWHGGTTAGPDVVVARQNLPLIVSDAQPNAKLGVPNLWGATLGNAVRVWRSGIGVDARGNLIYLAAPEQTAASLARALIHAGAVRAIELDINAEWSSFITYPRAGAGAHSQPPRFVGARERAGLRHPRNPTWRTTWARTLQDVRRSSPAPPVASARQRRGHSQPRARRWRCWRAAPGASRVWRPRSQLPAVKRSPASPTCRTATPSRARRTWSARARPCAHTRQRRLSAAACRRSGRHRQHQFGRRAHDRPQLLGLVG